MNASPLQLDDTTASPELRRAAEDLLPMFYADVRRIAHRERLRVGADEMFQTTGLVHEAYLRLRNSAAFNDRSHFLRASALAMRQVLVNYARMSRAAKRGGGAMHVSIDATGSPAEQEILVENDESVLAVHAALERLTQLNARLSQVVECRFFAGYSEQETAEALSIDERTVRRDWTKARAWLRQELAHGAS